MVSPLIWGNGHIPTDRVTVYLHLSVIVCSENRHQMQSDTHTHTHTHTESNMLHTNLSNMSDGAMSSMACQQPSIPSITLLQC